MRDAKGLARSVATPKIPKELLNLAPHILDSKAGHFEPSQFKDEFETELGTPLSVPLMLRGVHWVLGGRTSSLRP